MCAVPSDTSQNMTEILTKYLGRVFRVVTMLGLEVRVIMFRFPGRYLPRLTVGPTLVNPLTPELNPFAQRCLTRFLLEILLLEPAFR
jgi:hypothetical protein